MSSTSASSSRTITRTRTRPPPGTSGRLYAVKANCYPINVSARVTYYHYHDIIPDVKPIARRREILHALQTRVAPNVFSVNTVVGYDGKAALFTTRMLAFRTDQAEGANFEFSMSPTGQSKMTRVILRLVQGVPSNSLDALLQDGQPTEQAITANQILNVFLLQSTTPHSTGVDRVQTKTKIFSDPGPNQRGLPGGFEIWHGFFMNARPALGRMLLNLDTTVAVMYQRGDLISLALAVLEIDSRNVRALENAGYIRKLQTLLKRLRVVQQTAGKVGKVRTIKEIVPEAGRYEFEDQDGQKMTVEGYFRATYNYRLNFPRLPGIRSNKGDVVPFELLRVLEGQMYRRQLSPTVQRAVLDFATKPPAERFRAIERGLATFDHDILRSTSIDVIGQCVTFNARILVPPKIALQNSPSGILEPRAGVWDLYRNRIPFYRPCRIGSFALANFDTTVSSDAQQRFVMRVFETMSERGINVECMQDPSARMRAMDLNPQGDVGEQLKQMILPITKGGDAAALRSFLLLVILPPGGSEIRKTIKVLGDIRIGFATQCLMEPEQINRLSSAYILNIILKINVRMGGQNSAPQQNGMDWLTKGPPTMIIGADVSHPGPGIMRPSITGIAYSLDNHASTYCALTSLQPPRLEIIEGLKELIKEALRKFEEYNTIKTSEGGTAKFLPHRIVFYRDGVSEGEYQKVADHEFNAIKEAINEHYSLAARSPLHRLPKGDVAVTFVVVGKRHHIRFFPQDPRQPDTQKDGNCPPGLVADTEDIAHPSLFDFYLLSHAGIKGTSRPAHYIVLKDENHFDPDSLQAFSYALCHSYAAATRSVSIPAPVYYADLVCQRSNIHLRDEGVPSEFGSEDTFDEEFMEQWRKRFSQACEAQKKMMYFV